MEYLTRELAKEYCKRAAKLPPNNLQDIGKRRELRIELQNRCNLTELEAINIINGYHIDLYVRIFEIREEEKRIKEKEENNAD